MLAFAPFQGGVWGMSVEISRAPTAKSVEMPKKIEKPLSVLLRAALSSCIVAIDGTNVSKESAAYRAERWSRLSKQVFRVDKWSVCRG